MTEESKITKIWKIRYVNQAPHDLITCDHVEWPNSRRVHYNFYMNDELIAKIHEDRVLSVAIN